MFDLKGKTALVTGSSRGIGKQIALALAKSGADVIIHGRKMSDALKETADEIQKYGVKVSIICGDVSKTEEIEKIYENIHKLDILVNNAAVLSRYSFLELPLSEWDRIMETNARGYFYSTQLAARIMAKQEYGRIINISSISQYEAAKGRCHYCASKGAIAMLTKNSALELAEYGITVNAILPGSIHTDFNSDVLSDEAFYKECVRGIPMGRIGKPEDIGGAAVFLASDEAAYVTGTFITIDGGKTL